MKNVRSTRTGNQHGKKGTVGKKEKREHEELGQGSGCRTGEKGLTNEASVSHQLLKGFELL